MTPMKIRCPHCRIAITISDEKYLDKAVRCSSCKAMFRVTKQNSKSDTAEEGSLKDVLSEAAAVEGAAAQGLPLEAVAPGGPPQSPGGARREPNWRIAVLIVAAVVAVAAVVVAAVLLTRGPSEKPTGRTVAKAPAAEKLAVKKTSQKPAAGTAVKTPAAEKKTPQANASAPKSQATGESPARPEFLVLVNVAQLWKAQLVQKLLQLGGEGVQKAIEKMKQETGLTPADLEAIVYIAPRFLNVIQEGAKTGMGLMSGMQGGPMGFGPGGEMQGQPLQGPQQGQTPAESQTPAAPKVSLPIQGVVVVHTLKPFDAQKLTTLMDKADKHESVPHAGQSYHRLTLKGEERPLAVWLVAKESTIVMGDESEVKKCINAHASGRRPMIPAKLPGTDELFKAGCQVIVAIAPSDESLEQLKAAGGPQTQGGQGSSGEMTALVEEQLRAVAVGLRVSDTLAARVLAMCKDAAGAQKLAAMLQKKVEQARKDFAGQKESLPAPLFAALEQTLGSVKATSRGRVIELSAALPTSFFEKETLTSLPQAIFGLMMGGAEVTVGGEPVPFEFAPGGPEAEPKELPSDVQRANLPLWTMDTSKMKIPDKPAYGLVHGRLFIPDRAELNQSGWLKLRQGKDFFPDLALEVALFLKEGEKLDGRTFRVTPNGGFGARPHIILKWRNKGKSIPDSETFMGMMDKKYAMLLEFGNARGGKIPGRIYICLPDKEHSVVAGTFTVALPGQTTAAGTGTISGKITVPPNLSDTKLSIGCLGKSPEGKLECPGVGFDLKERMARTSCTTWKPRETLVKWTKRGRRLTHRHINRPSGLYLVYVRGHEHKSPDGMISHEGYYDWKWIELNPGQSELTVNLTVDPSRLGALEVTVRGARPDARLVYAPLDESERLPFPKATNYLFGASSVKLTGGKATIRWLREGKYQLAGGGTTATAEVKAGQTAEVELTVPTRRSLRSRTEQRPTTGR